MAFWPAQGGEDGLCAGDERVHRQDDLAATHAGGDADALKVLCVLLEEGREGFLHADGAAAAAQVAREGQQLLLRQHGDGLVARGAGDGLQVQLLLHRDDADQVFRPVAGEDEGLVDHFGGQVHLGGHEGAVVVFVGHIVFAGLVGDFRCVQVTQDVGFDGFCHV